ncbi:aminoacyl-tRNA hydrolase [Lapidilactobacillus bayanensis]|uniref:aminoacyl-tRNA hydrolase n=1 Tax=Lapidilactobacillus bayanensis TaxID=2485998 RepID=UPI000F78C460|nr:aminoacyl-tRNA hydrolase [Lapidilactobacillus bayanensis]
MRMIVGLGNPGQKYEHTKHNVGFDTVQQLADSLNLQLKKNEFSALTATTKINGEKILLVKPLTYMNDSGRAVGDLMRYYQFKPEEIAVIQDDLDMPVGKLRLRTHGASGGHNGIKSIISATGSQDFNRVKIGIQHPQRSQVVNWVLTPFAGDDVPVVLNAMDHAVQALTLWINEEKDFSQLMNQFN